MYEHQERIVKSLADRVDSTIEAKLHNCILNKLKISIQYITSFYSEIPIEIGGTTS